VDEVETVILPRLVKALGSATHPQALQVQGMIEVGRIPPDYEAARRAYRGAALQKPGQVDLMMTVLRLDMAVNDLKTGALDARRVLAQDTNNSLAHFVMGSWMIVQGDLKTAEWHFRRSAEGENPPPEAVNNLADLLRRQGRLDEAETIALRAVALAPESADALDTLACVYLDKGQMEKALERVVRARKIAPDNWQIAFTEARVLMGDGRKEEARVLLNKVRKHLDLLPPPVRDDVVRIVDEWRSRR
jgi:tetratricopeptide (TPR) repeat protein